jgi:hypothetical protein
MPKAFGHPDAARLEAAHQGQTSQSEKATSRLSDGSSKGTWLWTPSAFRLQSTGQSWRATRSSGDYSVPEQAAQEGGADLPKR